MFIKSRDKVIIFIEDFFLEERGIDLKNRRIGFGLD